MSVNQKLSFCCRSMAEEMTNGAGKIEVSSEEKNRQQAFGWAARDDSGVLYPFSFSRRNNGDNDVTIKILFCGICHSDLHCVMNEWADIKYPIVPGHEIAGIVTELGSSVKNLKIGDRVGVGCMVNSCRACRCCEQDLENYCPEVIATYNSVDEDGTVTYGGFSDVIVVNEHFVVRFPDGMPLDRAAPLLCAGITVYSPMKHFGWNTPREHLGVVGLGGVGHLAVKFAKAFGMRVTVISRSPGKEQEAKERLGADAFLISSDSEQLESARGTMDGIINTVSAAHAVSPLFSLLKAQGKMVMVGAPNEPLEVPAFSLISGGKMLAGSGIGGISDTQEMMDFAARHDIAADIELIRMEYVNKAMERLSNADVRYRFVIDVGNTLSTGSKLQRL